MMDPNSSPQVDLLRTSQTPNTTTKYKFNFPFQPYDIQEALMSVAYDTFEQRKFGLLESPTGTGKTLSLICSSLTWLRDHQSKGRQNLETKKRDLEAKIEELKREEESSADWLSAQTKRQDLAKELAEINRNLDRLIKFELKNEARRHAKLHGIPLENYSAFIEGRASIEDVVSRAPDSTTSNLIGSQESNASEITANQADIEKKIAQQEEDHIKPKVYFSSRTHSQLSQFINEVKKTSFADASKGPPVKVAALASRANLCVNPEVLKLREPSAINERCMEMQKESSAEKRCPYIKANQVNMLKEEILTSVQDIEDIVGRGRSLGSCPYYASRMAIPEAELVVLPYNNLLHRETRQASSLDLKDSIVIIDEAHNILETICSIHSAPINGLQLIGSHSILSRYHQKYHSRMTPRNAVIVKIIVMCLTALLKYLNAPRKHLKDYECPKAVDLDEEGNMMLASAGDCNLAKNADGKLRRKSAIHEQLMVDIKRFRGSSNIEPFNVFKIIDHFNRSQMARKLLGFYKFDSTFDLSIDLCSPPASSVKVASAGNAKAKARSEPPSKRRKGHVERESVLKNVVTTNDQQQSNQRGGCIESTSLKFLEASITLSAREGRSVPAYPIYTLVEFLRSLTNDADDGKILTDYYEGDILRSSLKFLLLNPSSQFKQMVQEVRSIVLAGGTMQPFNEFTDLLFKPLGIDQQRLSLFSCGHVIKSDHLYVAALSTGLSGRPLELSYKTRSSFETIDDIGRTVMVLSTIAPAGMVCFLPSYEYEQVCFARWTQIGIISRIESRSKQVFREPKQTSHLKPVFDEYSKAIERGKRSGRGALLFCVVGGKMSEGINFNDDLGRCVVMIGLPYANIKSGELQEKMAYYDRTCKKVAGSSASGAGQQYYENLCIKGINQSIGRAIRHRKDYAAIVLLDRRYSSKVTIKAGLPGWMNKSLVEHGTSGPLFDQLKEFFDHLNAVENQSDGL